jgi:hypothetical protein
MVVKARDRKRIICHETSAKNVRQIIGKIYPGMEIYGINAGQFSFINLIEDIILQIDNPVDIDISSWTVARFEISRIKMLIDSGKICNIRFVTDRSFPSRHPKIFEHLVEVIDINNIRMLPAHCKFVVISNNDWNIALRTSMNLNQNKRLENFEISDCKLIVEYLKEVVDGFFQESPEADIKMNKISASEDVSILGGLFGEREIETLLETLN